MLFRWSLGKNSLPGHSVFRVFWSFPYPCPGETFGLSFSLTSQKNFSLVNRVPSSLLRVSPCVGMSTGNERVVPYLFSQYFMSYISIFYYPQKYEFSIKRLLRIFSFGEVFLDIRCQNSGRSFFYCSSSYATISSSKAISALMICSIQSIGS